MTNEAIKYRQDYEVLKKQSRKAFLAWKRKHRKIGESSWTFDDFPKVCDEYANHWLTKQAEKRDEAYRAECNN